MKRTERFIMRLTKEEKANLEKAAKNKGMSASAWVRSKVFGKPKKLGDG